MLTAGRNVSGRRYRRVMSETFDPGPGYRWATRRENVTAFVLDVANAILAAAAGAIAGALVFGVIGWVIPQLFQGASLMAAQIPAGTATNGGSASASEPGWMNLLHNGTHTAVQIMGLIAGIYAAYVVGLRVLRALPVHSGPLRPAGPGHSTTKAT